MRTLVIAEMASAHDGSLQKALELIDVAARAGADVVKAEFWSDPDRLADRRRVPHAFREHYRRYQVPAEWLAILKAECDEQHVEFMCTAYLPEDIAVVDPFVQLFKIAGFEVQDRVFWSAHRPLSGINQQYKLILASVPMSVEKPPAVSGVGYLHCVQAYPAKIDDLHLAMIRRQGFDGFSDHSGLVDAGAAAVLAGAGIVEAHVKLETTDPENYDAGPHAHTPASFTAYVHAIRRAETMLGSGAKMARYDCEEAMRPYRVIA